MKIYYLGPLSVNFYENLLFGTTLSEFLVFLESLALTKLIIKSF